MSVVVAEDSMLVREGIVGVLTRQAVIDVVAACADLPELLAAVQRCEPDVVVTDARRHRWAGAAVRMPPEHSDEGSERRSSYEHGVPRSESWCFRSTPTRLRDQRS